MPKSHPPPYAGPMRPDQLDALAKLRGRRTMYEIEIVRPDGETALICYTSGRSGYNLRNVTLTRILYVERFLGIKHPRWKPRAGCDYHTHDIEGGGIVRFSGRTRRDVIMGDNPLPYIGAVVREMEGRE